MKHTYLMQGIIIFLRMGKTNDTPPPHGPGDYMRGSYGVALVLQRDTIPIVPNQNV